MSSVVEWVETTGKSVEEAKDLALDQLGVDEREAEFELLEEPKSGLFGRVRGEARVRARIVPKAPPAKTERRRRSKKGGDQGEEQAEPAAKRNAGSKKPSSKKAPAKKAESDDSSSDASDAATSKGSGSSSSGAPAKKRQPDTRNEPREKMDASDQEAVLEEFLSGLATAFGLEGQVGSTWNDDNLTVHIEGEGLGLLVGPRLATLDAIQEVARNALQRQAAGREYARVRVDVCGVRERRRNALSEFVTSAAEQVRDEDATVVFEVMNSPDRKQVHDVVSELDGVESSSEGEDPRRRVVLRQS